MKLKSLRPAFLLLIFAASSLGIAQQTLMEPVQILSPDSRIQFTVSFGSAREGVPTVLYAVAYRGVPVIQNSELGFDIQDQPRLGPELRELSVTRSAVDENYTPPYGKSSVARNHYNGARINFQEDSGLGRKLSLEVRVFDDGAAFRYSFPEQEGLKSFAITRELTQFTYAEDATAYPLLLPGFQSAYEDEYQQRLVTGMHPNWLIGLPLLAELPGKAWIAITEADIDNYPGMYLRHPNLIFDNTGRSLVLTAELSPHVDRPGIAVTAAAPLNTPWRVLMIADDPGRLVESNIVLNLNDPARLTDTSWIRPGKAAWDWWSGDAADGVKFTPGMNTATMEHYIDFAAQSGFPYMLIDGGWSLQGKVKWVDDDITRTTPDIDMPALLAYAEQRHVKIWLWAHWASVDRHMDEAFPLFQKWGIAGVKIDFMNRDDQWMVNFYRRVLGKAAENHLMIDFHGAYKPDGMRRTYPNLMNVEAVLGEENLKSTARTTPAHNTTLPFTRMLAGPMDYTPGGFRNSNREDFVARNVKPMVLGTRAHQLALYVILESPLEMVSDYPEAYKGQRDFNFIREAPTAWDETRVLAGRPMDFISMARRKGQAWFVGSITNWEERDLTIPLNFLGEGKYIAEIYADAADANKHPTHTDYQKLPVDRSTVLHLHLASGGGNAIWIHPAS